MRRYWIDKSSITNESVHLTGESFHHIFDVCRQDVGSKFEVLIDDSVAFLVEVTEVGKKSANAKVISQRIIPPIPDPKLVLAISIPRYHVMDAVIEKAVELGVAKIQPFFSEYSFIRKANSLPAGKMDRWEKIVKSATQQSGRGDLMKIEAPCDFKELSAKFNPNSGHFGLFAYEGPGQVDLTQQIQSGKAKKPKEIWMFIGSEGGFSQTEVQVFCDWGLSPTSLGSQILRVETACITLAAILKYEFGLLTVGAEHD